MLVAAELHESAVCLCPTLGEPVGCSLPDSFVPGDSLGKNTGVGCHALFQRFATGRDTY